MNIASENQNQPAAESSPKTPKSRRMMWIGLGVTLLTIAALPWIIANTPLRNVLLSAAVGDPELRVSSGSASFGWITPIQLTALEILHPDESLQIRVDRLSAEKSWLDLLLSRPELGQFEFDGPTVDIVLKEADAEPAPRSAAATTLSAAITNAHVVLRDQPKAEPVIDLENVDLTLGIEEGQTGRVLVVDPITVFDHLALTPELCNTGLQLVAPIFADEVSVQGAVSLAFTKFRIPLDASDGGQELDEVEISGHIELHGVSASLKNEVTRQLTALVAGLLNKEAPDDMRLADEVRIDFEVRDRRVYHEGLAFALPDISPDFWIRTSGSVGMDARNILCIGNADIVLDDDVAGSDKELSEDIIELIGNVLDRREESSRRPGGLLDRLFKR